VQLRIVFPKPGFFLTDVRLAITVDGVLVYNGSFTAGVDLTGPIAPGPHRIATLIDLGIAQRHRTYDVVIPEAGLTFQLAYSRLWGNFKKAATIT
jgi:hypothetical protein